MHSEWSCKDNILSSSLWLCHALSLHFYPGSPFSITPKINYLPSLFAFHMDVISHKLSRFWLLPPVGQWCQPSSLTFYIFKQALFCFLSCCHSHLGGPPCKHLQNHIIVLFKTLLCPHKTWLFIMLTKVVSSFACTPSSFCPYPPVVLNLHRKVFGPVFVKSLPRGPDQDWGSWVLPKYN